MMALEAKELTCDGLQAKAKVTIFFFSDQRPGGAQSCSHDASPGYQVT